MEVEKEEDSLASISNFCRPAASQEEKFRKCRLYSQVGDFQGSYQFSSSPEPAPAGIVTVSPPTRASSPRRQLEEEDTVFHAPPEHHFSSPEDELYPKGVRNRYDRSKRARVSAGELDDEADPMKIRVPIEVFDGETLPVDVTEEIVVETPANKGVHSAAAAYEVIVLEDNDDSGEKMGNLNSNKDSHGGQKNCDLMKGGGGGVFREVGLLNFEGMLSVIFADMGGACDEDVGFFETAKRRGLTYPRPRWWPPEADGGDRW